MSRERQIWKPILSLAKYFGIINNIIPYAEAEMENKRLDDIATNKELHLLEALRQLLIAPNARFHCVYFDTFRHAIHMSPRTRCLRF